MDRPGKATQDALARSQSRLESDDKILRLEDFHFLIIGHSGLPV